MKIASSTISIFNERGKVMNESKKNFVTALLIKKKMMMMMMMMMWIRSSTEQLKSWY